MPLLFAAVLVLVEDPVDDASPRVKPGQLRVATWFSPVERFRPVLNSRMDVKAYFQFPHLNGGWYAHPLIVRGEFGSRYALFAEGIASGRLRLTSAAGWLVPPSEVQSAEVSLDTQHDGFNLAEARSIPRSMSCSFTERPDRAASPARFSDQGSIPDPTRAGLNIVLSNAAFRSESFL
jgi:hypothetical protein